MMKTRDTVALLCTAVALLAAAWLTHSYPLWSFLGNYTVPWFCNAVAIAVLLVTLTAVLTSCAAGKIPVSAILTVLVGSSLALGVGMLVDSVSSDIPKDWAASVGEWIGFTVILAILFWLPRLKGKHTGEQTNVLDSEKTQPFQNE